jgi:hypothetical protein
MDIKTLAVGQRLRLIQDVEAFPLGSLPKDAAGTIETISLELGYLHLRMDDVFPALALDDNLLEVYDPDLWSTDVDVTLDCFELAGF